jgi:hypothetical protein
MVITNLSAKIHIVSDKTNSLRVNFYKNEEKEKGYARKARTPI